MHAALVVDMVVVVVVVFCVVVGTVDVVVDFEVVDDNLDEVEEVVLDAMV